MGAAGSCNTGQDSSISEVLHKRYLAQLQASQAKRNQELAKRNSTDNNPSPKSGASEKAAKVAVPPAPGSNDSKSSPESSGEGKSKKVLSSSAGGGKNAKESIQKPKSVSKGHGTVQGPSVKKKQGGSMFAQSTKTIAKAGNAVFEQSTKTIVKAANPVFEQSTKTINKPLTKGMVAKCKDGGGKSVKIISNKITDPKEIQAVVATNQRASKKLSKDEKQEKDRKSTASPAEPHHHKHRKLRAKSTSSHYDSTYKTGIDLSDTDDKTSPPPKSCTPKVWKSTGERSPVATIGQPYTSYKSVYCSQNEPSVLSAVSLVKKDRNRFKGKPPSKDEPSSKRKSISTKTPHDSTSPTQPTKSPKTTQATTNVAGTVIKRPPSIKPSQKFNSKMNPALLAALKKNVHVKSKTMKSKTNRNGNPVPYGKMDLENAIGPVSAPLPVAQEFAGKNDAIMSEFTSKGALSDVLDEDLMDEDPAKTMSSIHCSLMKDGMEEFMVQFNDDAIRCLAALDDEQTTQGTIYKEEFECLYDKVSPSVLMTMQAE